MKVPEDIRVSSIHDDDTEEEEVGTSPWRKPAGLSRLRHTPQGAHEPADLGDVPQVRRPTVPAPVLDACSVAARHMGHSSIKVLGVSIARCWSSWTSNDRRWPVFSVSG
jgi:hypothetical protein